MVNTSVGDRIDHVATIELSKSDALSTQFCAELKDVLDAIKERFEIANQISDRANQARYP